MVRADRRGAKVTIRRRIRNRLRLAIPKSAKPGRRVVTVRCDRRSVSRRLTVRPRSAPAPLTRRPVYCEDDPSSGAVTLSVVEEGRVRTVASVSPPSGWQKNELSRAEVFVGCSNNRRQWSADFTRYVFEGIPPVGDRMHVAMIDTQTGRVTDLTALRQGTGFSDPTLSESEPSFLGAGGNRISFGGQLVAFRSSASTSPMVLDIRQPARAAAVATRKLGGPHGIDIIGDHIEQQVTSGSFDLASSNNGALVNPSGTMIASTVGDGQLLVWPAVDPSAASRHYGSDPVFAACLPSGNRVRVLGWRDSSHLLIAESASQPGANIGLVTYTPAGQVAACRPVLPPTDLAITDTEMSPDGTRMFFAATGPSGRQALEVSLAGDAVSAPKPAGRRTAVPGEIFFPVDPSNP